MDRRKVVFLDRDGVINEKAPEGDYVKSWKEFRFLPGAVDALAALKKLGFILVVVTNQRGVALGVMSEERVREIHRNMAEALRSLEAEPDRIYYCPHDRSDACSCRKPKPGMISRAVADLRKTGVEPDMKSSYMIGDSESDIVMGETVGLKTVRIGAISTDNGLAAESLLAFSQSIQSLSKKERNR